MPSFMFCKEQFTRENESILRALGVDTIPVNNAQVGGLFFTGGSLIHLPLHLSIYAKTGVGFWSAYDHNGGLHFWTGFPLSVGLGLRF